MSHQNPLKNELYQYLQSSTEGFDQFADQVFDGVWIWNLENPEEHWMSPKFWEFLGYAPNETNDSIDFWKKSIHPEDQQLIETCLNKHVEGIETDIDQAIRYLHKDGSTVYIRYRGFSIKNEDGKPYRMIGIHSNLTEFIDLKNSLNNDYIHIKERLNLALDGSQDGVWDWNLETNEVFYSPRWKSILGYKDHELSNAFSTWEKLLHPDDLETTKEYVQKFLESGEISFETRFRMQHKDGHYVPLLSRARKALIPNQKSNLQFTHLIGTHVDLSDIIEVQEQLNQQIEITNTYLNTTSALMIALDTDANITMLNKKAEEVLGVSEASLQGKSWFKQKFLPEEIHSKFKAVHRDFINQKIDLSKPVDHELITHNGERRMFTWSNTLLKDKKGQVIGSLSSAIDITERNQIQQKLEKSESLLIEAQKLAQLGHYTLDIAQNHWGCSTELDIMFGIDDNYPKTIQSWLEIIHPEHRQMMEDYFQKEVITERKPFDKEYKVINQDSQESLWVHGKGTLKFDELDNPIEMFGTIQNISKQKQIQDKLTLASNVYKSANEGIMVTDNQGNIVDVNSAFTKITGYSKLEVYGKKPSILNSGIHPQEFYQELWQTLLKTGSWKGEVWNRRKNGEVYPEMITISTIKDENNQIQNYLALFSDITLQKGNESKLKKLAHFDSLTGLPNRSMFTEKLNQAIIQADIENKFISLAFLDLDGFKQINDSLGHEIGDQLLKIIGSRYSQEARETDIVARLGGDEFVILLNKIDNVEQSLTIYDRFLEATRKPIVIDGNKLEVSCSIGIAYYPQALPVDSDQLIRQADNAMYQAKISGKNSYHIFDDEQDQVVRKLHQKIIAINQAISNNEFVLFYQPKIDMRNKKIIGVEALIRWQHPQEGLLPPADFLPAIEKNTTSILLDKWVIEQAFMQSKKWVVEGINIPISVNLGAQILQNFRLIEFLEEMMYRHPEVSPDLIELEVLESSALKDMKHASLLMKTCEELGFRVSIDDFGTGYSSLEYLKTLPVTYLKIDQSFVRDMLVDTGDLAILKAVIGLAEAFGMQTIAEGVETDKHCEQLIELGCHIGQGYGIAKPMPTEAFEAWLKH
ncbi:hypothetical protein THMIRHAM_20490 [Thiomicrorhabdus immobilis]|uniref:Uncharacterized protein n=1 Tax=Thiomicrorhabdus immobilis TaxID=2791037 RepID=A0ABN6D2P8_9GAMM|nr:EAL domain-containing protein [Thiomicrorhabdus immobilis]BCN94264.1 hypothetical protein THMIRHAM_20490 [Thiomicrorhabdus immobilis]